MFSQEFFIQRSFEVVWAVFRVAEHSTRSKIKQALEDRAIDYLISKDINNLNGLEEIIRLASQIGEINKINSAVLLREIGNLRSAIFELEGFQKKALAPAKNPQNAPNLEESFSRPPMKISEIINSLNQNLLSETNRLARSGNEKIESGNVKEIKNKYDLSGETVLNQKEMPITSQTQTNDSLASKNDSLANQNQSLERSGNHQLSPENFGNVGSFGNARYYKYPTTFEERKEVLIKLISKRNLCHIKDLLSSFPNVSARTLRYDIQRLVDKGIIERVGTGGPNSFFRLKK
jgi:hypothetical protein